jgi:hypothetical protein
MKVAVVCEDHTHDQFILRPLLEAALATLGKPRARVHIVSNPRLTGFDNLIRRLCEIVVRYELLADVIVVAFDVDCEDGRDGRSHKRSRVQQALSACQSPKVATVGAVQELEVWALWGSRGTLGIPWSTIREERHPKEVFFEPLVTQADRLTSDGGRSRLMELSLTPNIRSLTQGCPEVSLLIEDMRNIIFGVSEGEL